MTFRQKIIAAILAVIFLGLSFYLIYIVYGQSEQLDKIEADVGVEETNTYLIHDVTGQNERYKIMNIVYDNNIVYAVVHMDNGNIKVIPIDEAFVDKDLDNLNNGYLYRENNQIYIRSK